MISAWFAVSFICVGKYGGECRVDIEPYPTRIECIENGLLQKRPYNGLFGKQAEKAGGFISQIIPNKYCTNNKDEMIPSTGDEVRSMQEKYVPCVGMCRGYNPYSRYNIETGKYEPAISEKYKIQEK